MLANRRPGRSAVKQLVTTHRVANSSAEAIGQWFNAGGMIQFYDFPLDVYLNVSLYRARRIVLLSEQPNLFVCRLQRT